MEPLAGRTLNKLIYTHARRTWHFQLHLLQISDAYTQVILVRGFPNIAFDPTEKVPGRLLHSSAIISSPLVACLRLTL